MKKRKTGRSLGRVKSQRDALKKALLVGLVEARTITTTKAKAKELQPFAERAVTNAKKAEKDRVSTIRELKKKMPEKTAKELIEISKQFEDRKGGYTRIIKLPKRKSDAAEMAIIEFVEPANNPASAKDKQDAGSKNEKKEKKDVKAKKEEKDEKKKDDNKKKE